MDIAHILIDQEVSQPDEQLYYQHCGHFPHSYAEYFHTAALDNEPGDIVEMLDNLKHVPTHLRMATINYSKMLTYNHVFANGKEIRYSYAGETPFIGAARKGHFVIVKILLQAGADISLRTMYQGEEFDTEGVVKRELAKTRLAIYSIWKGSFIPGDQVNSRLTPYIRMILDYQSNYEAILMLMAPTKYIWGSSYYSSSLMGDERFKGFRDTPNLPTSSVDLDLLYRGFYQRTLQNTSAIRHTIDTFMDTMKLECQRQGKIFRI